MPVVPDDDVVKNFHPENSARFREPLCHADVGLGW